MPPALAATCDVAITKPLKANALEDLVDHLESRTRATDADARDGLPPPDAVHKGLTKAALIKQLVEALKAGARGSFLPANLAGLGAKPKKIPLAPPVKRKVVFPPPAHDTTIESLISCQQD